MDASDTDDAPRSTRPDGADSERVIDLDADESLPDHLDVGVDVPVPDVIDQRRAVVQDDDDGHR